MQRILFLLLGGFSSFALAAACRAADVELTVHDAIRLALQNNLQLQVEELTPSIAAEGVRQARGEFDPVFSVEGYWEESERRQNAIEFLSTGQIDFERIFEEESTLLRSGVAQKLPLGTVVDFNTRIRRMENTATRSGAQGQFFSPEYETFAGVDITQPLLRGFGTDTNLAGIRVARIGLSMAEEERHVMVVNVVSEVVNTYYDMAFGQEDLRVKQEALDVANQFLRENQRRLELGRMAPIDVAEARVRVAQAEEDLVQTRDFLRDRELRLRQLIYDRAEWRDAAPLRTRAELPDEVLIPEEPERLFASALELRPDYRLAEEQARHGRIRESYARNQALPQLDLRFSYGYGGLDRSAGTSYDRVIEGRHPQWVAGLVFSVPIGNQEGRARITSARKMRRQALLDIKRIEHDIALDLQNAVARLETIDQRLRTARESLRLAEEALRIEETRLDAGRTTSYRVLELQTAVSDARTRELAAMVDAQKALAQVWAVSGRLLLEHGFYLAEWSPEYRVKDAPIRWNVEPVRWDWHD